MFANFLSLSQLFKSKTIWATIAAFTFNGVQAVHPIVSADTATQLNMIFAGVIAAARAANTTQGR